MSLPVATRMRPGGSSTLSPASYSLMCMCSTRGSSSFGVAPANGHSCARRPTERWARTAPDDGHYGALDEYYGPYGVESGENPLYLRARGGAGGGDILSELAPRDALEASRVIESHRYDLFAATDGEGRSRLLSLLHERGDRRP